MRRSLIVCAAGLGLTPLFLFLYWDHADDFFGTDTGGWWRVFGFLAVLTFFATIAAGFVALVLAGWSLSDYIEDRRMRREPKQLESDTSRGTQ